MYKVNKGTKLFIRFLREIGIKYIFVEEILLDINNNHILNNDMNGDLLKYFNIFIPRGLYSGICRSFEWNSTKNGRVFWSKMSIMWNDYLEMYNY